jgi:hypothetical protein
VRTGAGVKQSDGGVSSRWFVRQRSTRGGEPEEEEEVGVKKNNLPPLPYLYPESRGRGRGGNVPLPRPFLIVPTTCGHVVGRRFQSPCH